MTANFRSMLFRNRSTSAAGVRNRDRDLSRRQFGQFLVDASATHADLVVTPEYAMPWGTLVECIQADVVPAEGKLWALGCESIKYSELGELKQTLASSATVLYEHLEPDDERFVDPLAYVFLTEPIDGIGSARTVVLVQFKTHPMGDVDHFEVNGMQRGRQVYEFGGSGSLRLVSLICSDAFAFEDRHAKAIYDRALIIHIQLNEKPRHERFLDCRRRLFAYGGDATEILCLNWAENVQMCCGEGLQTWQNIAGSAWYLRPDKFDGREATLSTNHRRGLYYTWAKTLRAHALFFNYRPATYLIHASKVAHIGVPGAASRRRGPQLTKTCMWNDAKGAWREQPAAEDGFSAIVGESGGAAAEIRRIADIDPFEAERVLALCAGEVDGGDHQHPWHDLRRLDSCVIDASEVICRLTFCQDPDKRASNCRVSRLRRCGHLWNILNTSNLLPPSLADLIDGFSLGWSQSFPHQNAVSAAGNRATVIYMGEESSAAQVETIAKKVAEYLHRASSDADHSLSARQRLVVWFRQNDEVVLYDPHRYVKIDQTGDTSEFDIGREA